MDDVIKLDSCYYSFYTVSFTECNNMETRLSQTRIALKEDNLGPRLLTEIIGKKSRLTLFSLKNKQSIIFAAAACIAQ